MPSRSRFFACCAAVAVFVAWAPARAAIALAAPAASEVSAAGAAQAAASHGPRQIGYARALPALATASGMQAQLDWTPLPEGGQVAAVRVASEGAAALRVGMRVGSLPAGAILRFYAPESPTTFDVPAARALRALARNRHDGDMDGEGRMYWSPIVEGASLVIEIEVPRGGAREDVVVTAPVLSHFVVSPAAALKEAASGAASGLVYTRDAASFACPGTLVAPQDGAPGAPYFLTAQHCIATQSAASSLQPYWLDASAPGGYRTVASGAMLLHAAAETDTALVELDGGAPRGVRYARWPGPETAAFTGGADAALEQWLAGGAARPVIGSAASR